MISEGYKIRDYEIARDQIKSGDILLCSGNALFSRMIQKVTGSKWSHVAFVMRITSIDRIIVLESVESIGVRAVSLSSYLKDYNGTGKRYPGEMLIARHSEMQECLLENLSKTAVDLLGHPYNSQEIMRISGRIAASKFINFSRELPPKGSEYICSEYVAECYRSVGINITPNFGFIAPADFANDEKVYPVFGV